MRVIEQELIDRYLKVMEEMYVILPRGFKGRDICRKFGVNNMLAYTLLDFGVLEQRNGSMMYWVGGVPTEDMVKRVVKVLRLKQRVYNKERKGRKKNVEIKVENKPIIVESNVKREMEGTLFGCDNCSDEKCISVLKERGYEVWKIDRRQM